MMGWQCGAYWCDDKRDNANVRKALFDTNQALAPGVGANKALSIFIVI